VKSGNVYDIDALGLFGTFKKIKYFIGSNNGKEEYSGRTDVFASPFIPLNGEEINVSLINYSQYGPAVAFYNINKSYISGWNPSD